MKNRNKSRPRQPYKSTFFEDILGGIAFFGVVFIASSVIYLTGEVLGPVIGCWLKHIHSYVLELFSFDCQCK